MGSLAGPFGMLKIVKSRRFPRGLGGGRPGQSGVNEMAAPCSVGRGWQVPLVPGKGLPALLALCGGTV